MDVNSSQEDLRKGDEATTESTTHPPSLRAYDTWTRDTEFFLKYEGYGHSKWANLPIIGRLFRLGEPIPVNSGLVGEVYNPSHWQSPGFLGWLTAAENRIHKIGTIVMLVMAGILIYLLFLTQQTSQNLSISLRATQQAINLEAQLAVPIITATSSPTATGLPLTALPESLLVGRQMDLSNVVAIASTPTIEAPIMASSVTAKVTTILAATLITTEMSSAIGAEDLNTSTTTTPTATIDTSNVTQELTATRTATSSAAKTQTPAPTETSTLTNTLSNTLIQESVVTDVSEIDASATALTTHTSSPVPTAPVPTARTLTAVPTKGSTPKPTATNTATNTVILEPTDTNAPTNTPEPTTTSTPTHTSIAATATAVPTKTQTPTSTRTPTKTPTKTPTPKPTSIPDPTSTRMPTATRTPTNTFTPTATHTPTDTSTPSPTAPPTVLSVRQADALGVPGTVIDIVDGETIVVRTEEGDYTIGYLGIDAQDIDQPLGLQAKARNEELALGKAVYIYGDSALLFASEHVEESVPDASSNKSGLADAAPAGRLMRYVFLLDGRVINIALVEEGYATVVHQEPELFYAFDLRVAQRSAIEAGLGIWMQPATDTPALTAKPVPPTSSPTSRPPTSPPPTLSPETSTPTAIVTSPIATKSTIIPATTTLTPTPTFTISPTTTVTATRALTGTFTIIPTTVATTISTSITSTSTVSASTTLPTPLPTTTQAASQPPTAVPLALGDAAVTITGQSECSDIVSWNREATLSWLPAFGFDLPPGYGYEAVVWANEEDSIKDGRGLAPATRELSISIDGHAVLDQPNSAERADEVYQWGVLLVRLEPYQRLKLMSPRSCPFKIDASVE